MSQKILLCRWKSNLRNTMRWSTQASWTSAVFLSALQFGSPRRCGRFPRARNFPHGMSVFVGCSFCSTWRSWPCCMRGLGSMQTSGSLHSNSCEYSHRSRRIQTDATFLLRYNDNNTDNHTFPVRRLGVHPDDVMISRSFSQFSTILDQIVHGKK
jgi:hypothetical protein